MPTDSPSRCDDIETGHRLPGCRHRHCHHLVRCHPHPFRFARRYAACNDRGGAALDRNSSVNADCLAALQIYDHSFVSQRIATDCTISGICLALHFTAWVSSLQHTTVLVSVVVVSTGPIWVAILEVVFLRIRLSRLVILGLLVALIGGALIGIPFGNSANDLLAATNTDNATLTGALLALLGALTVSVYMLIGRKLRATLPVVPYVWLVYGIASLCMIMAVAIYCYPGARLQQ